MCIACCGYCCNYVSVEATVFAGGAGTRQAYYTVKFSAPVSPGLQQGEQISGICYAAGVGTLYTLD